jgi:hypothetical protein
MESLLLSNRLKRHSLVLVPKAIRAKGADLLIPSNVPVMATFLNLARHLIPTVCLAFLAPPSFRTSKDTQGASRVSVTGFFRIPSASVVKWDT